MVNHLMVSPSARKRVKPEGKFTSQLIIDFKSDLLLGFLSNWGGALLCHALLLASQILVCNFTSLIWRHSHLPGGCDLGGLGEGDEDCFGVLVRFFGATLICSCTSNGNVAFMIQTIPSESLFLAVWWPPLLVVLQRGTESAKWTSHGNIFYFFRA